MWIICGKHIPPKTIIPPHIVNNCFLYSLKSNIVNATNSKNTNTNPIVCVNIIKKLKSTSPPSVVHVLFFKNLSKYKRVNADIKNNSE